MIRDGNGTTLRMTNLPAAPVPHVALWTNNLLSKLRPGGVWVVPRSVSTVMVLSHDPKHAEIHCIFPDPKLVATLLAAGWLVQPRQRHED